MSQVLPTGFKPRWLERHGFGTRRDLICQDSEPYRVQSISSDEPAKSGVCRLSRHEKSDRTGRTIFEIRPRPIRGLYPFHRCEGSRS